ncbi:MAG: hypothetical protein EA382_02245 [Spirochaetaceae bacterium]|nr:MAG: hypothetical protein EA382_02245 [Spirochaetaceae bacterium]
MNAQLDPMNPTPAISHDRVLATTTDLLSMPPVSIVTELGTDQLRALIATFVDRRHTNDVLYRSITAIRTQYALAPGAYVVEFPRERFELPVDLREIDDRPGLFVALVKTPRGVDEVTFDLAEVAGPLADHLRTLSREDALRAMREMSGDGQEFLLHDRCDPDDRFAHRFEDGVYSHTYRIATAALPEVR